MAIPLGTENKRQVYMVAGLFALVAIIGGYELYDNFGGSSAPTTPPPVVKPAAQPAAAGAYPASAATPNATSGDAERLTSFDLDPTVHFARLAESEDVEYAGTGRNIFSAESAPAKIEEQVA